MKPFRSQQGKTSEDDAHLLDEFLIDTDAATPPVEMQWPPPSLPLASPSYLQQKQQTTPGATEPWLGDYLWSDMIDLQYFDEIFNNAASVGGVESAFAGGTASPLHLDGLSSSSSAGKSIPEELDVAALLANDMHAAFERREGDFVEPLGGWRHSHYDGQQFRRAWTPQNPGQHASAGAGTALTEARFIAALKWNRALQGQLRADLALLEGPVAKGHAEWTRLVTAIAARYNRRSRKRKLADTCQEDPCSVVGTLVRVCSAVAGQRSVANARWLRDFVVQRVLKPTGKWTAKKVRVLLEAVSLQRQRCLAESLLASGVSMDAVSGRMSESDSVPVNWHAIACELKTSAGECEAVFAAQRPKKERPWTREEIRKLKSIAKEGPLDCTVWWRAAMETGRTSLECAAYYQRHMNTTRRIWTKEEDAVLIEAVSRCGLSNWMRVAEHLEGRTGQQCLHRYQNSLKPDIRRGKWTAEEDEALKSAVEEFRSQHASATRINWAQIREDVPGRTDSQCRERWANKLDPALKGDAFTAEEDSRLLATVERMGEEVSWSRIAREVLPGRTDAQLQRRWKTLTTQARSKPAIATVSRRRGRKPKNSQ